MSGGAPKEIFLQLTPQFERQSGHKVEFIFAVMSTLRDKLAAGEKADVLVMPTNMLDGYQKNGVVQAQAARHSGLVSINAVIRTGAPKPDLSTPDKVKHAMLNSRAIIHATPGATPSGTHMGKLIEQLGIADAMKGKIIHRPALDGGVQLVASGEAEIGFYPKSEVVNTEGLTVVGPLPARDPAYDDLWRGGDGRQRGCGRGGGLHCIHGRSGAPRRRGQHAGFDPPGS